MDILKVLRCSGFGAAALETLKLLHVENTDDGCGNDAGIRFDDCERPVDESVFVLVIK